MTQPSQAAFLFVLYNGPSLPKDSTVQLMIRRQAMRDVATARRARNTNKRHKQRQNSLCFLQEQQVKQLVAQPLAPIGANLPADFFTLVELMPLTGLHLGITTLTHLILEPARTWQILSASPGSHKLLSFLPSRYNQVPVLRYMTDAILAKLRCMKVSVGMRNYQGDVDALHHYNMALEAIQQALGDEMERLIPETLFALELLGVFGALHRNWKTSSWKYHVNVTSQLIQLRGPDGFQTEFEKALCVAHLGPTVMDAFLNNTACFLDSDDWIATMRAAVCHDELLAQEADLVLSLWANVVRGPRLFKEATDVLYATQRPSSYTIETVIANVEKNRASLISWLALVKGDPRVNGPVQESLRGTCVVCRMINARLLYALSPRRYCQLEDECQGLAQKVLDLNIDTDKKQMRMSAWRKFLVQGLWIARATIRTKELWRQHSDFDSETIDIRKFDAWCDAIERKRPPIPE